MKEVYLINRDNEIMAKGVYEEGQNDKEWMKFASDMSCFLVFFDPGRMKYVFEFGDEEYYLNQPEIHDIVYGETDNREA